MTTPAIAACASTPLSDVEAATDSAATRPSSTHSTIEGEAAPRLPHEHDESSSSVGQVPDPVIKQAPADLDRGLSQTDRGEVTDELYAQMLRSSDDDGQARENDAQGATDSGHATGGRGG